MERKIDGVLIVSKFWDFLPKFNLQLENSVSISKVNQSSCKGVQKFKNKDIFSVFVTNVNGYGFYIYFVCARKTEVDYRYIRQVYEESIDHALDSLGPSETRRHWMGRCCSRYSDVLKNSCCKRDSPLKVYATELEEFGKFCMGKLRQLLGARDENVFKVYAVVTLMGQSMAWDVEKEKLCYFFKLNFANELVLHICTDYMTPGKCLLWNRSSITKRFRAPDYSFYPGFTSSVGNFVFKQDIEEQIVNVPFIKVLKFYSSICKTVHRNKPAPFKQNIIAETLSTGAIHKYEKCIKAVNIVRRSIEDLMQEKCVHARFEVVYSVYKPVGNEIYETLCQKFDELLEPNRRLMYEEFDFQLLEDQIALTVFPIFNALDDVLSNWKQGIEINKFHYASINEIILAEICEDLLQFFVYGSTRELALSNFNQDMVRELGIKPSTFASHRERFRGLTFCNWLQLNEGRLVFHWMPDFKQIYVPQMIETFGEQTTQLFWDWTKRFIAGDQCDLEIVTNTILAYIRELVIVQEDAFCHVEQVLGGKKYTIVTVLEYLETIFNINCPVRNKGFVQFLRTVLLLLPIRGLIHLMELAEVELNNIVARRESCSVMFLMPDDSVKIVTLAPMHFARVDNEVQEKMILLYQRFNHAINETIADINIIRNVFNRIDQRFATIANVIEKIDECAFFSSL